MVTNAKASARHKFILFLILLFAGVCLLGILAWFVTLSLFPSVPAPRPAPDPLPAVDIVYQGDERLGFINADGSDATEVRFYIQEQTMFNSWTQPFIVGDPPMLVVTDGELSPGNIFVAHPGQTAVYCSKWWGMANLAPDGRHILLITNQGQENYLPEDCGTGNPPEKVFKGVAGPLSPDERFAAEVRAGSEPNTASLIVRNIETGEERVIGEGHYPVWSRDGQWLAYIGADGIYIVRNSPNVEPRRLVPLEVLHPELRRRAYTADEGSLYYPPVVSWSPDGKWLVYHEYDVDSNARFPKQYSIFKVNVETGETTRLVDGGLFPHWRWPVEEP